MRKILALALVALPAAALPALGAPAAAQTYAEQRRFDAAQARYDAESELYQRERERYMRARARDGRGGYAPDDRGDRRYDSYDRDRYQSAPPPAAYRDERDPYTTDYDAARYYRDDSRYPERRLGASDEVYRGSDGRYYCKRGDGSVGLVIGGAGGAILGNIIDGGRHRTAGTLIGGALGALAGAAVAQNQDLRCR
jgi:hypothetical protein